MITQTSYKDRPAICFHSGPAAVLFLPEDGGKMASFQYRDREYLAQSPGTTYLRLGPESDYVACECSGFDDMFPTIDPFALDPTSDASAMAADHGEVCRHPMETRIEGDCVVLQFSSPTLPVRFRKAIRCAAQGGGVELDYEIANESERFVPCLWAAHCMLRAEKGARIIHPYAEDASIRTMFGRQLSRTETLPFSMAGESYKYYFRAPAPQGYAGYRYRDGRTFMLRYPPEVVPYLGVWINNGSFKGMYNIALEPCTAPYDRPDAAQAASVPSALRPGETIRFRVSVTVEEAQEV